MNLQQLLAGSDSIENLVSQLNTDVYERIKLAIELGKWADGSRLTSEQLENCMQLLILYEAHNLGESERTGQKLGACKTEASQIDQPITVKLNRED